MRVRSPKTNFLKAFSSLKKFDNDGLVLRQKRSFLETLKSMQVKCACYQALKCSADQSRGKIARVDEKNSPVFEAKRF